MKHKCRINFQTSQFERFDGLTEKGQTKFDEQSFASIVFS